MPSPNKFVVIGYYTENTPYERVMNDFLKKSLNSVQLPYDIVPIQNAGSWKDNTLLKAKFVYDMYNKHRDMDLLYLDADSEVMQYPVLFDSVMYAYDIAVFYLDWKSWYKSGTNRKELVSNILYIRHTPVTESLLLAWIKESTREVISDQAALDLAIEKLRKYTSIRIYEIPIEYSYIVSLPDGRSPHVLVKDPVIKQHQCSRLYRRKICK